MQDANGRLLLAPSDLNDYVSCQHLTTLARQAARGDRERPPVSDEGAQLLQHKGELHELQFLDHLRREGRDVIDIRCEPRGSWNRTRARSNRCG